MTSIVIINITLNSPANSAPTIAKNRRKSGDVLKMRNVEEELENVRGWRWKSLLFGSESVDDNI